MFQFLSTSSHFDSIAKGVVDSRDIIELETTGDSAHWEFSLSGSNGNYTVSVWNEKDGKLLCRSSQSEDLFYIHPSVVKESMISFKS